MNNKISGCPCHPLDKKCLEKYPKCYIRLNKKNQNQNQNQNQKQNQKVISKSIINLGAI